MFKNSAPATGAKTSTSKVNTIDAPAAKSISAQLITPSVNPTGRIMSPPLETLVMLVYPDGT